MSDVGFFYSAAALIINGLVLLGRVSGKAALPLNLFVGGMQIIFPTLILIQSNGDAGTVLSASSTYLFGFTYLYVALNELIGASGEGLGWFSLFVTVCACAFSAQNFASASPVYGVLWLFWGLLWSLFFAILALGKKHLERPCGWFTLLLGIFTVGLPGFLELLGLFPNTGSMAWVMLGVGSVLFVLSFGAGSFKRKAHPLQANTEEECNKNPA